MKFLCKNVQTPNLIAPGGESSESLCNYQGGGSANPYGPLQRGEGGSKIRKIALRNLLTAPYGFTWFYHSTMKFMNLNIKSKEYIQFNTN